MTVTLAQVRRAAKKSGVTVDYEPENKYQSYRTLQLIAPAGKCFGSVDGLHTTVTSITSHVDYPAVEDFSFALDDIASLEDCTDPDCEWCHPTVDE